jgi:Secretion system C-terminal sorting domain/FG-GAP-like repeat
MGSSPQVVDWNSDGQRDLVSGDRYGYFNVFTQQGASLVAYYRMRALFGDTINVGGNSQPAVTDWDRDGKKDILLGSEEGYIRYYRNMASDTMPGFLTYTYIQAGGSPIYIYRVNPYVVDLDLDGKRDLVCGANDGYLYYFHNIGSDTNPTLDNPETLKTTGGVPILPSGSYAAGSRAGFCDWNNDGALDFLLSGYDGYVDLYLGEGVGIEEKSIPVLSTKFMIAPNPARKSVNISYNLNRAANVELSVFDAMGRKVKMIESGNVGAGDHLARWQTNSPAGIYLVKLSINDQVFSRRIVLTN